MDFDIRRSVENGISFKQIFVDIILIAISVFLAFRWQSTITEVINKYFPAGENLMEKIGINVVITVLLVAVAYLLLKSSKTKNSIREPEMIA